MGGAQLLSADVAIVGCGPVGALLANLLGQSGLTVELPPSKFQIERDQNLLVVTLGAGQQAANIHFGRKSVSFEQLEEIFERMRQDGSAARSQVLLPQGSGDVTGSIEFQPLLEQSRNSSFVRIGHDVRPIPYSYFPR